MMKFDIGSRRSGKTIRMIQWLLNAPEDEERWLVVHSEQEAQRISSELKRMGLGDRLESGNIRVISYARTQDLKGSSAVVGIDNLELVLGAFLGIAQPITRVTATGEIYKDD